jgi:hypothetical protein
MRRLPEAVKRRIVEHLACYHAHAEVASLIADEFGIALTPRHVRAYDPMSFQFAGSERWLDYFNVIRKQCAAELGRIAIAHRAYRLRRLQQMHDQAMCRGDYLRAMAALEQAAKEVGNWYVRS